MNSKLIVGSLIGAVASYLLGFLIWGLALSGMMSGYANPDCNHTMEEFNMGLMIVSSLFTGIMYAYIFSRSSITSVSQGATYGAIIAVLLGLSMELMMYAMTKVNTSINPVLINIPANAIWGALVGAAIGWWMGRK